MTFEKKRDNTPFFRRVAAPEFSRGFQPTVGVIFISRRVSDG